MTTIVKLTVGRNHPDLDDDREVVEESGGVYTVRREDSSQITATESVTIDGIKFTVEAP